MVKDASYLCAFRLNPIKKALLDPIRAEWSFKVVDMDRGLVAFQDESIGEIDRWHWDFGGGKTSDEQHPIIRFEEKDAHKVVTLKVTGAEGSSKRTRYWEVMIR
ncbi:MAG: PKD domain-containing protein [Verrucomicrobia bacterium]|nr:PKD domain-containing protein [Verrucomicrobiota bacterium]